jgi:hypothetical protein
MEKLNVKRPLNLGAANISDKQGAIKILKDNEMVRLKKIWGDQGYQGLDLQIIFSSRGIELEVVKRATGIKVVQHITEEMGRRKNICLDETKSAFKQRL